MTWEIKDGHCAECGAYGSWLEFIDAQQLPKDWFAVTEVIWGVDYKRVLLCSVKCVEVRRDRDLTAGAKPPECTPPSKP